MFFFFSPVKAIKNYSLCDIHIYVFVFPRVLCFTKKKGCFVVACMVHVVLWLSLHMFFWRCFGNLRAPKRTIVTILFLKTKS